MSNIAAGTTTTTSLVQTGDITGNLVFQTNGNTTALTLTTAQNAVFTANVTAGGNVIVGTGLLYANGAPFSSGAPALNINLQQNYGGF